MGGRVTRRALAAALAAVLVAACGSTATTEPGEVHAASAGPAVVAGPAVTVADVGNSILFDAEPAIRADFGRAVAFDRHTLPAFGFDTYAPAWRSVFGHDVVRYHPRLVVVLMGNADFGLAERDPQRYRGLLDEAVRLMTADGAKVLWLGLPPLPLAAPNEIGRRTVNALYAELPRRFPGVVRYVSTDDVLGVAGLWTWTMPDDPQEPIRKVQPDGTPDEHLCPAGGVRVARLVRTALEAVVGPVAPAPAGWDRGGWRDDARYNDPPGACTTVPSVVAAVTGLAGR